ncbi:MAG: hypothetical protein ACRDNS_28860, partial [Trebonia sp.]
LSAPDAAGLLEDVTALSAPGSRLAFEAGGLGSEEMRSRATTTAAFQGYTELWEGGLADPVTWLAAHGWDAEQQDAATVAAGHGRDDLATATGRFVVAGRT